MHSAWSVQTVTSLALVRGMLTFVDEYQSCTQSAIQEHMHAHTTIQNVLDSSIGEVNDGADASMHSPLSQFQRRIAELERDTAMMLEDI